MKALSMPVNLLVIVVVSIIILIALIIGLAYFSGQTPSMDATYRIGCIEQVRDCSKAPSSINVKQGDKSFTLLEVCSNLGMDENVCKKNCGCIIKGP